ncbi:MAG TPA: nuclear transport factor 2 family protein [Gemmatimonadales bacterium]|jgi:predicted SnoaL-like aldol condensation-catalyzing enzyme|nr:nuclear transport factor 2 family protein [Gemmatimonadales bacterium]
MRPTIAGVSLHKEAAMSFLQFASSGRVREAFDAFVATDFRHHNPHFPGDARSLIVAMEVNAQEHPQKTLQIEHAMEEGDLVVVHSRVRLKLGAPEIALVHIFRFEDDRVAELWDIAEPVPPDSPNENGMF